MFTFRVAGEPAEPCEENRRASEPPKRVPPKRVLPTAEAGAADAGVVATGARSGGGEVPLAR